ncbi:MAG: hypothetical protein GY915_00830, partial [bacterium]|nr:hypothetical protein [bacterium]
MSDTKKCSTCGVEKPATPEFFTRDGSRKDGLYLQCKGCRKLYRENNKEKEKERHKLYRENNKEKEKERRKFYYENNKEKFKEWKKEYRENNKEKIKEYRKLRYENNKEKFLEQNKLYRENNKQNNPYGIYKITNKETGKIYIGETINFND